MVNRDRYLQNLPKVDENREIQTNSFDALNSFLPKDTYCLRDERIEDYGVDASLEILEDGKATNFRAQIQLKGTRSLEPKQDGSYSLSVSTNNLNYLLNNPISIYIVYIEPNDEFRFVWARNEFNRLDKENPDWLKQETITLKFNDILDWSKLDEIKTQITKHSSLNRELNEVLVLAHSNVMVEINPETFEITDKKAIFKLISDYGINLINEGFANEVLEKINLLENKDRDKSSIAIVKAYAEYSLGHYHTAKEIITILEIKGMEVSEVNQQIINWLELSCDYRLGKINSEDFAKKLRNIAENDDTQNFSFVRFGYIHKLLLRERQIEVRKELVNQLRDELEKIQPDDTLNESRLMFNYQILEAELGTIIKEFSKSMSNISLRKNLNFYQNISDLAKDIGELLINHRVRANKWDNEINEIFQKTENLILKADILVEKVLFNISELRIIHYHSTANGVAFNEIEDNTFEVCKEFLETAIQIYLELNLYERKLRAESYLAELMSLKGQTEDADKIFSQVSETSSKMGYTRVKANAENPLSKMLDKIIDTANSIDFDEKWANSSNEEMEAFAQDLLENLGLPQNRYSNIKKDVIANREINKEKLYWCECIELHQNLRHTESPETYYAIDPERFGHCNLYGYNSAFGNPNYETVILAFKKTYCEGCPSRKPKKS